MSHRRALWPIISHKSEVRVLDRNSLKNNFGQLIQLNSSFMEYETRPRCRPKMRPKGLKAKSMINDEKKENMMKK